MLLFPNGNLPAEFIYSVLEREVYALHFLLDKSFGSRCLLRVSYVIQGQLGRQAKGGEEIGGILGRGAVRSS
jgi:hypothetical protein